MKLHSVELCSAELRSNLNLHSVIPAKKGFDGKEGLALAWDRVEKAP